MTNGDRNKLRRFLKKCDILVVKKNCGNSRPCMKCLETMKKLGVRRVYYSFYNEIKVEKVNEMETEHVSAKFRRPWSEFRKIL